MNIALLFEQSGHFKHILVEHGHNAKDFDICNDYNETDYQIDLFEYINNTDMKRINKADLVIAFFPCTYFSRFNEFIFNKTGHNCKFKTEEELDKEISERYALRENYKNTLLTMVTKIKVPLIIENPVSPYIKSILNFDYVSMCRDIYGDFYRKPTCFFYMNGVTIDKKGMQRIKNPEHKRIKYTNYKGIERSLISPIFIENLLKNTYVNGVKLIWKLDTNSQLHWEGKPSQM